MKKKLILFDIDGILVKQENISGSTKLMAKHFGIKPFPTKVYMEGKTIRRIFKERLEEAGVKDPEKDSRFNDMLNDVSILKEALEKDGKVTKIPYVEDLIKSLIKKSHIVALLTGNTLQSSQVKLEHVDLWKYFKIGAYGSDTLVRSDLVPLAIMDAKEKIEIEFNKSDICIIGDTLEDIQCAKDNGVKIIAVATGIESLEHLKTKNPDFLFENFEDTDSILEAIET